jgi:hypothetical protein
VSIITKAWNSAGYFSVYKKLTRRVGMRKIGEERVKEVLIIAQLYNG